MIQIRKGTFETNSSSTHSICISKEPVTRYPRSVHFSLGRYGWEQDTVEDTASYLYTGIMECTNAVQETFLERIKNILAKHDIEATFEEERKDSYFYVDHGYELYDFLDMITSNEDMLLRFLFSPKSCVYTGNDNGSDETDKCNCACPTYNDPDDDYKSKPHPYHNPEHFEYFYKGN